MPIYNERDRFSGTIDAGSPARAAEDRSGGDFALQTADADGVATAVPIASEGFTLAVADLDGALVTSGYLTASEPRNLTFTTGADVGGYTVGEAFTVEGTAPDGSRQSERFVITDADGGEVITGSKMFLGGDGNPLTITFPGLPGSANVDVGVGVATAMQPPARWIWCNATGTIYGALVDDADGVVNKYVIASGGAHPLALASIHAGTDLLDFIPIKRG